MASDNPLMLVLAVAPFALAMSISPGPNNLMIAAIAGRHGARRTLPYLLGTVVGVSALLVSVGAGLGEVLLRWPQAHAWLKSVGVAYMLWLAWRIATASVAARAATGRPLGFGAALLFQWLNPKAWMMSIGAFSIFTTVGGGPRYELLLITGTFIIAFIPALALWTCVGVAARAFLVSTGARMAFNVTMAALIVLSAGLVWW